MIASPPDPHPRGRLCCCCARWSCAAVGVGWLVLKRSLGIDRNSRTRKSPNLCYSKLHTGDRTVREPHGRLRRRPQPSKNRVARVVGRTGAVVHGSSPLRELFYLVGERIIHESWKNERSKTKRGQADGVHGSRKGTTRTYRIQHPCAAGAGSVRQRHRCGASQVRVVRPLLML